MKNAKYLLRSTLLLVPSFIFSMENKSATSKIHINKSKTKNKTELNDRFMTAAQKGDLEEVKKLLLLGADIDAPESKKIRDTALVWAIYKDHLEVAKFLIANKANLNKLDRFGYTPIILAMNSQMSEDHRKTLVTLLIKSGADIYIKYNKQTALIMADRFKNKELYNIIKTAHDKKETLIQELTSAILNEKKLALAKIIIKNPNLKDPEGNNALHIAAKYYKVLSFNIIWKIQPNLFNKTNYLEQTPVDAYPEIICQLITSRKLSLKNITEDKNINAERQEEK